MTNWAFGSYDALAAAGTAYQAGQLTTQQQSDFTAETQAFGQFAGSIGQSGVVVGSHTGDPNAQAVFSQFLAANPGPSSNFWSGDFSFGGGPSTPPTKIPKLWVFGGGAGLVALLMLRAH